jgi:hypothetical protein
MPLSCASFRNGHANRSRRESKLLFFFARELAKRD